MSQHGYTLTPQAREDLIEIWNYIAEDSVDRADQALARINDALARLAQTPGIGHHRDDVADSRHRFWTVYSYVIVYREDTAPMQVVAIVHGARQLEAFLRQRIPDVPTGLPS